MNTGRTIVISAALALGVLAGATVSYAQPSSNSAPPEIQNAILARLAQIQTAAESLDADKVFSFVLENNEGALAQNGQLFLTRKEALESTKNEDLGLNAPIIDSTSSASPCSLQTIALATGEGVSSATTVDGRNFTTRFAQSVVFCLRRGRMESLPFS